MIHLKNWIICRGCFITYGFTLISFIYIISFNPFFDFSLFYLFLLVLTISSPTLIGCFYSFKTRKIKDLIRVTLGIGWGISLAEIWNRPQLMDKILITLFMIAFFLLFQKIRQNQTRKRIVDLCEDCKAFNEYACKDYKRQYQIEQQFNEELSEYFQRKLSWKEVKEIVS